MCDLVKGIIRFDFRPIMYSTQPAHSGIILRRQCPGSGQILAAMLKIQM